MRSQDGQLKQAEHFGAVGGLRNLLKSRNARTSRLKGNHHWSHDRKEAKIYEVRRYRETSPGVFELISEGKNEVA